MYPKYFKRVVDLVIATVAFILVSPISLLTCLFLLIANHGRVFFIQTRPGYKEKPFNIIKFKTMNDRKDDVGNLLSDDLRLTTIGKWVRKLSLDEIPQLLNVIKGDMSLIGPRPLLVEYLPLYNENQTRRHEVRPGITGWAQVNGRNAISWEKKFELDVYYVDHLSLGLDCKIVLWTIKKVLKTEGISSETSSTMEKFTGTK